MQKDASQFTGYPPPTSSTTYTPNQFFDVVLPNSSRGVVRIVGYMLRRILGWSDADGNPVNSRVSFSYTELIERANVSRSMIKDALDEAIAKHFIRCVREPRPKLPGQNAVSGLYELCWDEEETYKKNLDEFRGFYSGNGNLTYIPNKFFDFTVREESLSIIKVVGAIIRYTIGFQSRHGMRRQRVQMSFSMLQRVTGISSRALLSEAIQESLARRHIVRVKEGYFNPGAVRDDATAVYAVKWLDGAFNSGQPTKRIREEEVENFFGRSGSDRELVWSDRNLNQGSEISGSAMVAEIDPITGPVALPLSVRKANQGQKAERLEKRTRVGKKSEPGTVRKGERERFENRTSTEITVLNNNNKAVAVSTEQEELVSKLLAAGFDEGVASELADRFPKERITRQLEALPNRKAKSNRLGLLRRSIEEDWALPEVPSPRTGTPAARRSVRAGEPSTPDRSPEYEAFVHDAVKRVAKDRPDFLAEFEVEDSSLRERLALSTLIDEALVAQMLTSFDSARSREGRLREFLIKKGVIPSLPQWRRRTASG